MKVTSLLAAVSSALVLTGMTTAVFAQAGAGNFPNRAVKIVVPFAAGGPTDVAARTIGDALSKTWNQPVVIDNRAGAGGTVGATAVANADPDGYTILLGVTGSHAIGVSLFKSLPYDPVKGFEPISLAVQFPNAILANPALPANNLQELIALAQKSNVPLSYGSDGNGTASHLTMELLKDTGKFKMDVVQYKGSTPLLNDLVAGIVQVGITGLPTAVPLIKGGKLKLIAITTQADSSGNNFASIASQGFPGFAAAPWSGFFAPKGTPKPIVDKISKDIVAALKDPGVRQKLESLGMEPLGTTPEQFAEHLNKEIATWARAVEVSGAKVQ